MKFDGEFIIHYLLTHGFVHVNEKKLGVNQFSTIISDLNVFYCIKVKFKEEVIISNLPKSGLDDIETNITEMMMEEKQKYGHEEN